MPSESDASSTTSDLEPESLYDRLLALQDIIPPRTRSSITSSIRNTTRIAGSGLEWTGKALWIITSSVLLVGIPFVIAYEDDRAMAEQEMHARQQSMAGDFMSGGASGEGEKVGAGL
jgi:import receptor subunit TOM22